MAVSITLGPPDVVTLTTTWSLVTWSPVSARQLVITAPSTTDVYLGASVAEGGAVSGDYHVVAAGTVQAIDVSGLPSTEVGLAVATGADVRVWATR
jgi:hypothetical protein